ncbi:MULTISPECIES: hypothetical protein [Paenibacillus]|uniref:Holin n=1 Tax=Paenibacillus vini TaxID=1476024 RepID=A0ABQ4M9F1_9BACL|nr:MULTISPECIES: hypothetical protein [Paenibacillus]MBQ4899802.1 hypothetical protein [Paenibacillus sp. Marseille-P2973]MDN4068993.1 hypothetical protein [Paenibacillus vini]GIP52619.1 hypothetical protein J42TS3_16540 [Paenibacillus vini]
MRGYNVWRPVLLIATALLTNTLVTNLCILFGLERGLAGDIGFVAMIIAALVTYNRMTKGRRRK